MYSFQNLINFPLSESIQINHESIPYSEIIQKIKNKKLNI